MLVIKIVDEEMRSVIASKDAQVQYKINEAVSAPRELSNKGYNLLAFKSPFYACAFAQRSNRIFIAEANEIHTSLPDMLPWNYIQCWGIEAFSKPQYRACNWPSGTIMCREITLLKEISMDDLLNDKYGTDRIIYEQ